MKFTKTRAGALVLATAAMLGIGTVGAAGTAEAASKPACPTNIGRVACVDLTHQKMWVQVNKKIVFGPVTVRTGRKGYVTRTGTWHIYLRERNHWSTLYHVNMTYTQFFSGGEAFHGVSIPLSTPPGSHGCVNMTNKDAARLWNILRKGDTVKIFGRKPGT